MKIEIGGDIAKEFKKRWNQRMRWVRIAGYIVGVLLLLFGAACLFSPLKSAAVFKTIIAVIILSIGIVRFFEYFTAPVLIRPASKLLSAIFNIIIGALLVQMPAGDALTIFSCAIGIYLLISGVAKLSYAAQLRAFGVKNCGWVVVDGSFRILCAFLFFVMPMASVALLNVVLGLYLLIDGASILVETADTKNLEFEQERAERRRNARKAKLNQADEAEVVKKK